MATSRADLDLPRDESTEESCALVSSKELAKRIEEASGSSTPTEHAAWLKWASLGLLIFQNYCLTKRRVVACLAAAALVASMVAPAATSLGQALAESVTGACKLTISVEGVAQCRTTSPQTTDITLIYRNADRCVDCGTGTQAHAVRPGRARALDDPWRDRADRWRTQFLAECS